MKNKIFAGIIILGVVVVAILGSTKSSKSTDLTVGAILPITGPAALWGETVKNGMELSLKEKTGIKILYEDSKSSAADGISAYNSLKTKNVDLFFSELSSVAVPLSKSAMKNKSPLLVSLVAAEHSSIVNDFTTRYYTNPTNYATPAFTDSISPILTAKKLALLTRNDELGNSVKAKIMELAQASHKEIVSTESFMPAEKDFNTLILKVKNSGADAFIFVASTPGEAVGILKTAQQLGLTIPIVESSAVFADLDTRKQVGGIPYYSTSYDFSLPDKAVEFKKAYREIYGKDPNFAAAFGYDIVNLINNCKTEPEHVRECINKTNQIDGVAGTATQVQPSDFAVKMHLEKVD